VRAGLQMVYVVHSLATAAEPAGLRTVGPALHAPYVCGVKISQNRTLRPELGWILLQDPMQKFTGLPLSSS